MKAGETGGIVAVVKAVNTHINNPDVCVNGCGALWNMTFNGKNYSKHKRIATNKQLGTK